MRTLALALFALLAGAASVAIAAIAAESSAPRYTIDATLRPLAVSACGRYAIDAEARFTPEAQSRDGRYTLKAVQVPAVGCDPFPDPLFSDGFEGP